MRILVPKPRVRRAPKPKPFFDRGEGRRPARQIERKMRADYESEAEARRRPRAKRIDPSREAKIASLQERCENPDAPRKLPPVRKPKAVAAPPRRPVTENERRRALFAQLASLASLALASEGSKASGAAPSHSQATAGLRAGHLRAAASPSRAEVPGSAHGETTTVFLLLLSDVLGGLPRLEELRARLDGAAAPLDALD